MRPFIVRLAEQHRQNGWVANTAEGLSIAIEGDPELQRLFLDSLYNRPPSLASIASLTISKQAPAHFSDFQIKASFVDGDKSAFVLPDIATCRDCIDDIFNPNSRFYRYLREGKILAGCRCRCAG